MKKNYILLSIVIVIIVVGGLLFVNKEQPSRSLDTVTNKKTHATISQPIGSSNVGVFEGRTPCQDFLLAFTKFSVNSNTGCQRIKWLITFYQDAKTGDPTRYVFGVHGREESHAGKWIIKKGIPSDPEAIVYELHPDDNRQLISLLKVGNDHLFFLDENMHLLVGNKLLSYTLSKTSDNYETRP